MNSAGKTTDKTEEKPVVLSKCAGDKILTLPTCYILVLHSHSAPCGTAADLCTPATERKGPFPLNQFLHNRKAGSVS